MIIKKPEGDLSANLSNKNEIVFNIDYFLKKAFHKNEPDTCSLPFVKNFNDNHSYSNFIADYFMDDLNKGQKFAALCDIVSFSPDDFDVDNLTLEDKQKAFKVVKSYVRQVYGSRTFVADYHIDNGKLHYHIVVKNKDKLGNCYTTKAFNDFDKKERIAAKLEKQFNLEVVENRKCVLEEQQRLNDFQYSPTAHLQRFKKHNPAAYADKVDQLTAMNDFIRSTAKKSKSPQELFQILKANNIGIRINNDNAANLAFSFVDGNDNSLKASQVNLSMKYLKTKFKDFSDEQLKDIVRQAAEFKPERITHSLAWVGERIDFEPKININKFMEFHKVHPSNKKVYIEKLKNSLDNMLDFYLRFSYGPKTYKCHLLTHVEENEECREEIKITFSRFFENFYKHDPDLIFNFKFTEFKDIKGDYAKALYMFYLTNRFNEVVEFKVSDIIKRLNAEKYNRKDVLKRIAKAHGELIKIGFLKDVGTIKKGNGLVGYTVEFDKIRKCPLQDHTSIPVVKHKTTIKDLSLCDEELPF